MSTPERDTSPSISVAILCGGMSRRFGSEKAMAMVGERPLVQWIVDKAVAANKEIAIALMRDFANLDLPTAVAELSIPIRCINAAASPPRRSEASNSVTWAPDRLSRYAAVRPAIPPPRTATFMVSPFWPARSVRVASRDCRR